MVFPRTAASRSPGACWTPEIDSSRPPKCDTLSSQHPTQAELGLTGVCNVAGELTWVTPEAHRRLVDELDALTSRGSDVDATGRARMVELRAILNSVEVGTRPDDGLVESGMRVIVRAVADGAQTEFVLGDRRLLGHDLGEAVTVLSVESPLGAAVDGRHVGDEVTFTTPRGERAVSIIAATPVS